MPGSRCSKSVSSSTVRVPPFLPRVRDSVVGLLNPSVLTELSPPPAEPLDAELELLVPPLELEPHAASTNASRATAASAATALIDLMDEASSVVVTCPHWAFFGLRASL